MKLLVDMNLSPKWCPVLQAAGWDTVHWSDVGQHFAPDDELMRWAEGSQHVVVTHDLDFGAILAATQATGPSVVQVRAQDVRPGHLAGLLVPLLSRYEDELVAGALLVVDERRSRVRLLPLSRK